MRLRLTSQDLPAEECRAGCNVFSSELSPARKRLAPRNVLVAKHEQDVRQAFAPLGTKTFGQIGPQLVYLRALDRVLAKTRCAEASYRTHGLPVSYVGFTCRDRYLPDVPRRRDRWLCVVGDSHGNKHMPPSWRSGGRTPISPGWSSASTTCRPTSACRLCRTSSIIPSACPMTGCGGCKTSVPSTSARRSARGGDTPSSRP